MALTRQTMDEATAPIPRGDEHLTSSLHLYRTAREILDLFRAIIPTVFENEVGNIPRTAAVLPAMIASTLLIIALLLDWSTKRKFPPTTSPEDIEGRRYAKRACLSIWSQSFSELADQAMGDMLEKQYGQIHEIVGSRVTILGASLKSNESLSESGLTPRLR
jgi:hypothetical protein